MLTLHRAPQFVIRTVTETHSGQFRYVSSDLVGPFPSVAAAEQWHAARNTRRALSDGMVEPFRRFGAPVTSPSEWQPAGNGGALWDAFHGEA